MNLLESHRLLPCVVGLAISAALLWLAAEAQQRPLAKQAVPAASTPSITLPTVVITGKRNARAA